MRSYAGLGAIVLAFAAGCGGGGGGGDGGVVNPNYVAQVSNLTPLAKTSLSGTFTISWQKNVTYPDYGQWLTLKDSKGNTAWHSMIPNELNSLDLDFSSFGNGVDYRINLTIGQPSGNGYTPLSTIDSARFVIDSSPVLDQKSKAKYYLTKPGWAVENLYGDPVFPDFHTELVPDLKFFPEGTGYIFFETASEQLSDLEKQAIRTHPLFRDNFPVINIERMGYVNFSCDEQTNPFNGMPLTEWKLWKVLHDYYPNLVVSEFQQLDL